MLLALLPVGNSIREPLVVLSQSDEPVYVPRRVTSTPSSTMRATRCEGDVILRLSDPTLQSAAWRRWSVGKARQSWRAYKAAAENKPGLIAAANEKTGRFRQGDRALAGRLAELVLKAPVDGVIIRDTSLRRLTGAFVPLGMKLCRVVETQQLELTSASAAEGGAGAGGDAGAAAAVVGSGRGDSCAGQRASELSDQLLHPALASTSHGDVDVKPDDGSSTLRSPSAAPGGVKTATRRSTVIIEMPTGGDERFLADGMTGRGEIEFPRTTVAQRLWRLLLDSTTPDWHL